MFRTQIYKPWNLNRKSANLKICEIISHMFEVYISVIPIIYRGIFKNNIFARTFIQFLDRQSCAFQTRKSSRGGIPLFFARRIFRRVITRRAPQRSTDCRRVLFSMRQVTPALLPAFSNSPILEGNYPVHWERNALLVICD